MNGGYLMVSKTDTKLYEKLNKALTLGKPVLWYEDENTCYYIDTITLSGTDIILTKGGKTITIENDGDITESGNIQPTEKKLYRHTIELKVNEHNLDSTFIEIINDKSSQMTLDDIKASISVINTFGKSTFSYDGNTVAPLSLQWNGTLFIEYVINLQVPGYLSILNATVSVVADTIKEL